MRQNKQRSYSGPKRGKRIDARKPKGKRRDDRKVAPKARAAPAKDREQVAKVIVKPVRVPVPVREVVLEGLEAAQPTDAFVQRTKDLRIDFEESDVERMGLYVSALLKVNEEFNLTAITDVAQVWERHILDSLTLMPVLASLGVKRVVDVGSGGGAPGVPLAIAMGSVEFTLMEATGKKARFLEAVTRLLGLKNVRTVQVRAEDAGQDHKVFRERFDAATARAVGPMNVLLELTIPLAKVGGVVLAMKGERAAEDIEAAAKAMKALKCKVVEVIESGTGKIVVVRKLEKTIRMYPRWAGEPKRRPL